MAIEWRRRRTSPPLQLITFAIVSNEPASPDAGAHPWYHTLTFPDGSTTPGYFDTRPAVEQVRWPEEVAGGRCLDVGTFDGFWAFELERRGAAEVVALDIDNPEAADWTYDERQRMPEQIRRLNAARGPGFVEAARRMGSRAVRVDKSVYALDPDVDGMFDVVLCGALLLHLRDPIAALEAMRRVCRGSLVLVEALDPLLDLVPRLAVARINPDRMQWWRVNSPGLAKLVTVAGFGDIRMGPRFLITFGPGAPPGKRTGRLPGLAAHKPWVKDGMLYRSLVAKPRPPKH